MNDRRQASYGASPVRPASPGDGDRPALTRTIAQRLRNGWHTHDVVALQIRDRARHLEYPVVAACRECQTFGGSDEQLARARGHRRLRLEPATRRVGVARDRLAVAQRIIAPALD